MNGKQYQVVGQVERNDRDAPTDLATFFVRNKEGRLIQLDNLVKMEEKATPPQVFHYNRYKSATISAGLAPGKTIGDGIAAMEKIADEFLDESFVTSLSGPSRDFAESSGNTSFAFILALVLIYLVLSAQFESFRDPLIIMFTVPLAIAGALLSLALTDQTLNIFSQIGMIMLIGLVTKNGILIVDFANHKQREGLNKWNAVLEGSAARLRPILMTSLVTATGALPIALALGSASLSRVPLGVVIVGGVIFSLILTLYVIPAMYTFISGQKKSEAELNEVQEGKVASGTTAGIVGLIALLSATGISAQTVLSPEQVVEAALQNNAQRKVLQSDVKRWMTENQYLRYNRHPTLGLTGGAGYNINNTRQEFVSGVELSRNGAQAYQFNAGIAGNWQVYDGGRARLARELGAQQATVSQSQLNANATELTELVLNAYYTIAWLEQQLKLLEEQSQLIQFRFNLSDDRFKSGLAGQQEALQAQVDLNDVRNRIVANRSALQVQWALLRQLTGNGQEFRINTQLEMPQVPDSAVIYNQLLAKNPQLQLLQQQRRINVLNEQVAKTGYTPQVQLNAGYNFLNQRNQAGFLAYQFNHGFTASILATYPIFDQYVTRRNVEVAKVFTEQLDAQTKASTEQLFTTFQLALNDLALARQTLALEQSNEQTARQLLLIANERFKQGLSNALELREVQFSLENIQFRQLQARYQANLALSRLKGLGAL
jgi:outer membrane protein TolC